MARCGGHQAPHLSSSAGTRSPGAAGLPSRESSILTDADNQAKGQEEAFDFFEQQEQTAGEGPANVGLKGKETDKALEAEEEEEEEEALDPLGILR